MARNAARLKMAHFPLPEGRLMLYSIILTHPSALGTVSGAIRAYCACREALFIFAGMSTAGAFLHPPAYSWLKGLRHISPGSYLAFMISFPTFS